MAMGILICCVILLFLHVRKLTRPPAERPSPPPYVSAKRWAIDCKIERSRLDYLEQAKIRAKLADSYLDMLEPLLGWQYDRAYRRWILPDGSTVDEVGMALAHRKIQGRLLTGGMTLAEALQCLKFDIRLRPEEESKDADHTETA